MEFDEHIQRVLDDLDRRALLRSPRTITGALGPVVELDGRRVLCLCSNDYLGFASDPRIAAATRAALGSAGYGSGASRLIAGTNTLHRELEQALARFVGLPAALLFATGYAANVGALPALLGRGDVIFSDALNHASLIDGARLSRASIVVYRHRDLEHLAQQLATHRPRHRAAIIATESVFSMEGTLADLPALRALADRHGAGLLVDEAHALGVVGPEGRGLCARDRIRPDVLVGTLGKSFGCAGAFAAASTETVRLLQNGARSHVFSTAPPPSQAAAALAALDLVVAASDRRARVLGHAARIRQHLADLGHSVPAGDTPIVPVHIGSEADTMKRSAALLERGVFVQGIRPPTVPPGTSRLRLTLMATHTDGHVDQAIDSLAHVLNRL